MRIIINNKKIQRNKRIGNALTLISLAVLGCGLFFAFKPNLLLWSYVALVIGFVLTQFSMYYSSRFSRSPRYDELLSEGLETIRGEYNFYVHMTPVPNLLLGTSKFYVLHPVVSPGTVSYENGKWKEKGRGLMMRIVGQEGIGNPEKEIAAQITGLRELLSEKGIPLEEQPRIFPVLVVLSDKTQLGTLENPPYPVVEIAELKRLLRRLDREDPEGDLSEEEVSRLKGILG